MNNKLEIIRSRIGQFLGGATEALLAYELLLRPLASFGGRSECQFAQHSHEGGIDLQKGKRVGWSIVDHAREHLARKSTWRESYFLASFLPVEKAGQKCRPLEGMAGGYPT
jgi:hypothetical protein